VAAVIPLGTVSAYAWTGLGVGAALVVAFIAAGRYSRARRERSDRPRPPYVLSRSRWGTAFGIVYSSPPFVLLTGRVAGLALDEAVFAALCALVGGMLVLLAVGSARTVQLLRRSRRSAS
jgi:hypothetical protein